jgi:hypothetical protein
MLGAQRFRRVLMDGAYFDADQKMRVTPPIMIMGSALRLTQAIDAH